MSKLILIVLFFTCTIGFSQQVQTTIISRIATGNDDVEVSTRLYLSSSDLEIGGFDSDNFNKQYVALRFSNLALPANATVTKAYIQFTTKSASTITTSLSIKCQNGNAPAYTTYANIIARTYAPNTVAWNPAAWAIVGESGAKQQTPDLSALINAAKATGWLSGGALAFKIEGNAAVNNILNARSYEFNTTRVGVAQLTIEYQIGDPCATDVTPPTITNCPTNISLFTTGTNAVATWTTPTVTDNCTANITPSVSSSPTASLVSGSAFPIGTTTITYSAKDASNNNATPCVFTVTVQDANAGGGYKIFINELAPKGTLGISEDWIEIYNDNTTAVSTDSIFITGKKTKPFAWRLKGLTIPAKGFLVLIADKDTLKGADHIDLKLSADGESVFLYKQVNGKAVELSAFTFPALASDEDNVTFGVDTEGSLPPAPTSLTKFLGGTPRASNASGKRFLRINNTLKRGIVTTNTPTTVTLTAPAGSTIRYTTNHDNPSRTVGTIYTTPITFNTTTVLKTFIYSNTGESTVESFTYIYPTKGTEMTFPNLVTQADYENGLKLLPIISISTNAGVFDSKVEKICSFEYINKFGENLSTSVMAGVEGYGNDSYLNSDQRNLRMSFKSIYGFSKLRYPIFKKDDVDTYTPTDKFDKLELKIGQDGPNADGFGMVMSSQALINKTMREMGNIDLHTQYVHAFVNGKYHGVYTLKEKYDENFTSDYYGGTDEQYDVITNGGWSVGRINVNSSGVPEGTITNWNALRTAAEQNNFQTVKRYLNVNQYTDMMLNIMYFDNEWEFRAVADRNLVTTKFVVENHDTDGALVKISDDNEYTYDFKWTDPSIALILNGPGGIFGNLIRGSNKEFKTLVRDRVYEAFQKSNGALTVNRINAKLAELKTIIRPVFNMELARFNKTFYNDSPYFDEEYDANIAHLPTRYQYNLNKWLEKGLAHTLLPITFNQPSGTVTTPVLAINPNNKGIIYYTLDGSDPMGNDGIINPAAKIYTNQLSLNAGINNVVARVYFNTEFGPKTKATYTSAAAVIALKTAQILAVEGRIQAKKAVISWIASTQTDIDYFNIEKLNNQGNFETKGTINAQNKGLNHYDFTDTDLIEGDNIYRVKLVESTGKQQYSAPVTLVYKVPSNFPIYPNPVNIDLINIDLTEAHLAETSLQLYNSIGQLVKKETVSAATIHQMSVGDLQSGLYRLVIQVKGMKTVSTSVVVTE